MKCQGSVLIFRLPCTKEKKKNWLTAIETMPINYVNFIVSPVYRSLEFKFIPVRLLSVLLI